jgi:tetratricopeptide (TPR) repeat protein
MGHFDEARAVSEETLTRFPEDAVARNSYAELLRAMGLFDEARAVFNDLLRRFPRSVFSRTCYAQLLLELGEFHLAENVLALPAAAVTVDDWVNLHVLGMISLRSGNVDRAQEIFKKGVNAPFRRVVPYFRSGLVLAHLALGHPKQAKRELDLLADQSDEMQSAITLIDAHIHGALGDEAGTKRILNKVARQGTSDEEKALINALTQIYLVKNVASRDLKAANDNVMKLEVIIIFRAVNSAQRLLIAA